MRKGYRFQPTPEELVSYFLKEKRRDPDFRDPDITDVNIYKHNPCELPGLSSYQSDDQVWYFFCALDNKYGKSDRARRTAKGGSWKKTGIDRPVKAKDSNERIGIKKTLVFYKGSDFRKENKTNWIMHEYHEYPCKKNSLFKGQVVVCRIEKKPDKKCKASSALGEGQPSDCASGNNVAQDILEVEPSSTNNDLANNNFMEAESQLQSNQHISYVTKNDFPGLESHLLPKQHISSNGEDLVAANISSEINESQLLPRPKDIFSELEPLVPGEWDALYGLQSPISSGFSDDFGNLQWVIPDEFFGEETGHSLPPDVNSSQTAITNEISSMANEEY
ncbi:hypothetical protein LWI29_038470 [Acer saccharum]|uniref:NAC domain-containing protein n=1 Tax=Acer saccharum TaxID=4024 RepID=A0AA39S9G3_ACESA|nr:hypothetical protein LWI29_038470 [Acer saccharum]